MNRNPIRLTLLAGILSGAILVEAGMSQPPSNSESSLNAVWTPLFDGESLEGWVKRGGEATYRVEEGAIVGTTAPNTPNTFLCTPRTYSDFQLELEFRVDPELNSGVQIRSLSKPDYQNGQVHGYQVEIDPSRRAYTGGIYDEARRGWLFDLNSNRAARFAFRQGEWNQLRIEAIGSRIRTWINGVPASDLTDEMTGEGFIALQVHGVGERQEPLEVRWRKLRIRETDTPWPEDEKGGIEVPETLFQPGTLERLGTNFQFTEGPAIGPDGRIQFNDIPRQRTHVYDPETGTIELFRENTGGANGMYWMPHDVLISCEGSARRLSRWDRGDVTTLVAEYEGRKLNSPNDLVPDGVGGIYFTDPRYGDRSDLEQEVEGVYYLDEKNELSRVIDSLERPNGIVLSPDQRTLYVADEAARKIWAWDVEGAGKLAKPRVFADVGSDGMSVDEAGNVYCTFGSDVIAFDRAGREIDRLTLPEPPANCLIADGWIYITARTSLYRVKMNVTGLAYR